jgi:hypothetical protein
MSAVANAIVRWRKEAPANEGTTAERRQMPLPEAWPHVTERQPIPNRALLVTVAADWTGFFDNDLYENLAQAELFVLCERLQTETCFFSYNDHSNSPQRGSAHFCFYRYAPERGEPPMTQRQVMCYKESGWTFSQSGEPLPFEELEAYARPKKRDRLTMELLRSYGAAIGLPFWDPAVYGDEVVLLRWGDQPPPDTETTLKKLIKIFGQPTHIFGRRGGGQSSG